MKQEHKVNLYYSILLIVIGLFGFLARYYEQGDWQFTSLIPAFFGFILIFMTNGIKKENTIIAHIAVVITTVLALVVTFMFVKNLGEEFNGSRKFFIFIITALTSYIVLWIYIAGFIEKRKNK